MAELLFFTAVCLLPALFGLVNFSLRAAAIATGLAPAILISGLYYEPMGITVLMVSWLMVIATVVHRDRARLTETPKATRAREDLARRLAST
jgi:hypothetical protein